MKKRVLGFILVMSILSILITALPITASAATSGACGDNLTWTLDNEGTLIINGTGDMYNWSYSYVWGTEVPWYGSRKKIKNVVIENGVTSIGSCAFYGCSSLESITIPSGVTSIGDWAFPGCSSLESITIPSGVTSIGDWAFNNCSSLTSMTIPDSVTSIGNEAFRYCISLTSITIPDGVTSIGSGAFQYCSNLVSVTIPDSVTSIGGSAFYECSSLESITIGDGVTSIGGDAFERCYSIKKVNITDLEAWCNINFHVQSSNPLCRSGVELYLNGELLDNITIPNSVTSIGDWAFQYCSNLVSVTIPDSVTSIGNNAFQYCSSLESITIGDGVTSIGNWAFQYCSSLESITIGDGVTSIGNCAFYGCSNLVSVTIPDSVTSIGGSTFNYCNSLTNIYVDENSDYFLSQDGVLFNKNKTVLIRYPIGKQDLFYQIPDDVTSIDSCAFHACSSLMSVKIPGSVVSIGEGAFIGCRNLTNVIIPNSVTSIDRAAFAQCEKLISITIPDSVISLGDTVFQDCHSLLNVVIGKGITSIGSYAFAYCDSLQNISIPKSVTSFGYCAFYGTYNITDVYYGGSVDDWNNIEHESWGYIASATIHCNSTGSAIPGYNIKNKTLTINYYGAMPDFSENNRPAWYAYKDEIERVVIGDNVTSIGDYAFADCENLVEVQYGRNITKIGGYAFYGCDGLVSEYLPEKVNRIGNYAFADCSQLYKVVIPESVNYIGTGAFNNCMNLKVVNIPNNLKTVAPYTFAECISLNNITVPNGVIEIDEYAFQNCNELEKISLPKSLELIQSYAFSGCTALQKISHNSSQSKWKKVSIATGNEPIKNATVVFNDWSYDENTYNEELNLMGIDLSNKAYSGYKKLIEKMEKDYGFDDFSHWNWGEGTDGDDNEHNTSFVIGRKFVQQNGVTKNLVCVTIRGTHGVEWKGNMDFTGLEYDASQKEEYSFALAAEDVISRLDDYMNSNNTGTQDILFITGHSRGAAVANLVAQYYNDHYEHFADVYAYTYATPNTTLEPKESTNIYNFCFTDDFVPQVPLESWGYGKHGITYNVCAENLYNTNWYFRSAINSNTELKEWQTPFNQAMLNEIIKYTEGFVAPTAEDAYESTIYYYDPTDLVAVRSMNLHKFFRDYLAPVAIYKDSSKVKMGIYGARMAEESYFSKLYFPYTAYFLDGNVLNPYFHKAHSASTYKKAIELGLYDSEIFPALYGLRMMSIDTVPSEPVETEVVAVKTFLRSGENLSLLGYDIDDISTWTDIKWNGNNISEIDFSYKQLNGEIDLSNFEALTSFKAPFNKLTNVTLSGCTNLTNLDLSYNEISNIDLSTCTSLENLNLQNNSIYTLDLTSNTALNTIYISNNYLNISDGSDFYKVLKDFEKKDAVISAYPQKLLSELEFCQNDIAILKQIAQSGDNIDKLGWNIDDPSTYYGVTWQRFGDTYYVTDIDFSDCEINTEISLSELVKLETLSLSNNNIGTLSISNCESLTYVSCDNSNLTSIQISGCYNLIELSCSDNYLSADAIDSFEDMELSILNADNQKINAYAENFDSQEIETLVSFLKVNENAQLLGWDETVPGEWDGITWEIIDEEYHVTGIEIKYLDVSGELDLSVFDYLTSVNFTQTNIEKIVLPDSVTEIKDKAFYGCDDLENIQLSENLVAIGDEAFAESESLTEITIPVTVTNIGVDVFGETNNIKINYVGGQNDWNEVSKGNDDEYYSNIVYYVNGSIICQNIVIDEYANNTIYGKLEFKTVAEDGIAYIEIFDHTDNEELSLNKTIVEEITIGSNSLRFEIPFIGDNKNHVIKASFYDNETDKTLKGTSVSTEFFAELQPSYSNGFYYFPIDDSTAELVGYEYDDYELWIPVSLDGYTITKITDSAFKDAEFETILIPDTIIEIGVNAFDGCDYLETVNYIGTEEQWNTITIGENNDALVNADKVFDYSEDVIYGRFGEVDFTGAAVEGTLWFDYVYKNCVAIVEIRNYDGELEKTFEIEISAGTEEKEFSIPFEADDEEHEIYVSFVNNITDKTELGNGDWDYFYAERERFTDGDYTYVLSDGKAIIVSYNGTNTEVEIPATLGEYSVVGIDDYAFEDSVYENNVEITSLTLPSSIEIISEWALESLYTLSTINVSNENEHFCVVDNVLFDKDKTRLVKYPAGKTSDSYSIPNTVKVISTTALADNENLTTVTIPDSVTDINGYAFSGSAISTVTIPASVMNIETAAFSWCYDLSEINVSGNNTHYTAVDGVLYNKDKTMLMQYPMGKENTSVVVSAGVTTICETAFLGCQAGTVVLPKSLTFIDYRAFYNCENLKTVLYYGSQEDWQNVDVEHSNDDLMYADFIYNYDENTSVNAEIVSCYFDEGKVVANIKYNYIFEDCTTFFAIYNEDGRLVAMDSKPVTKNDTDATFTIEVGEDCKDMEVKAFFWESSNTLKPIGNVAYGVVGDLVLESTHPYGNNIDETKVYTYSGDCTSIDVTFSDDTETESGWDYIYIYDAAGNEVGKYSGTVLAGQTIRVLGNTVKIRLTSDGSYTEYGYRTEGIVVNK